jgi:DNA-binding transcriptional ArsR family regulator
MDHVLAGARYDIAALCELLAEPTRVAMALALMDGSARPAGELAREACVSAQTASSHLGKLVAGGLLAVEQHGRHRYYRIASDRVAHAIEALGVVQVPRAVPRRSRGALELARTCYRHLAGELGVALRERLETSGWLLCSRDRYVLSPEGVARLGGFLALDARDSIEGRVCLDWTVRRHHVGGPLGNALARSVLDAGWLERVADGRALRVTAAGERGLRSLFALEARSLPRAPPRGSSVSLETA